MVPTSVLVLLVVFYAGAVCATARAWFWVWRGAVTFAALRDVTGIGDRATLMRLFGLARADGSYSVTLAAILRHRRPAGIILADLPVHLLFLLALLWAATGGEAPSAAAIACAAFAHALLVAAAALSIIAKGRRALIG